MPDGTSDSPERHQSQPKPPTEVVPRGLPRRRVLQGFLGGAAAAVVGPKVVDAFRLPDFSIPPEQAEKRLVEAGLSEYSKLYETFEAFYDKYKALPTPGIKLLRDTLHGVAAGTKSAKSPEVELWRDGWGEKKEQAFPEAHAKLPSFTIDPKDTGDDPEKVREFLAKMAEIAPVHILASPTAVDMKNGGGGLSASGIGLNSIQDRNNAGHVPPFAVSVAFHEMTHAIDKFPDRFKSYVSKEDHINYLQTYVYAVDQYINAWLTTPDNEDIIRGTEISVNPNDAFKAQLAGWENALPDQKSDDDPSEDVQTRFNRITHNVGRKWLELQGRSDLAPAEQQFLLNPTVQQIMAQLVGTVSHRFVSFGPPFENWKYKEGSIFESLHNLINMQRLRSFALHWDADKGYQTIADHFGIPHLERPKENLAGSDKILLPEQVSGPVLQEKKLSRIVKWNTNPDGDKAEIRESVNLLEDPERRAQFRTAMRIIDTQDGPIAAVTINVNEIQSLQFTSFMISHGRGKYMELSASDIQELAKQQNKGGKPGEQTITLYFTSPDNTKLAGYKNVGKAYEPIPQAYTDFKGSTYMAFYNKPPLFEAGDRAKANRGFPVLSYDISTSV